MPVKFNKETKNFELSKNIQKVYINLPGTILLISHYCRLTTGSVKPNLDLLGEMGLVKLRLLGKKFWYYKNPEMNNVVLKNNDQINDRKLSIMSNLYKFRIGEEGKKEEVVSYYENEGWFRDAVNNIYYDLFERPPDGSD